MDKYENAVDQLKDGIKTYIEKKTSEIPCDRTFTALVTGKDGNNTYTISLNSVEYHNIKTIGGTCYINETVRVLVPQNNYNNMFIIKAVDDTQNLKIYKYENEKSLTIKGTDYGNVIKRYNIDTTLSRYGNIHQTGICDITDKYFVTNEEAYRKIPAEGIVLYKDGKYNSDYFITESRVVNNQTAKRLEIRFSSSQHIQDECTYKISFKPKDVKDNTKFVLFRMKGTIQQSGNDGTVAELSIDDTGSGVHIPYEFDSSIQVFDVTFATRSSLGVSFGDVIVYIDKVGSNLDTVNIDITEITMYTSNGNNVKILGTIRNNNGFEDEIEKIYVYSMTKLNPRCAVYTGGGTTSQTEDYRGYGGVNFLTETDYTTYNQLIFNSNGDNSSSFPIHYASNILDGDNFTLKFSSNVPIFGNKNDALTYTTTNDDAVALATLSKAINYKTSYDDQDKIFSTTLLMDNNSIAKIDIELLLENILDVGTNFTDYEIHYYIDDVEQDRVPKGRLTDGDNIVRLMYVVESEISDRKIFSVYLKPKSGTVRLDKEQELVTITGNGLLDQTFFDGDISIDEQFTPIIPINPIIVSYDEELEVAIIIRPSISDLTWGNLMDNNITWKKANEEYVW